MYPLFTRVALSEDLPEYKLRQGDIAVIVDQHEGIENQETGYSLEVFNAIGETIAVIIVEESKIKSLSRNEIFHIRELEELAIVQSSGFSDSFIEKR